MPPLPNDRFDYLVDWDPEALNNSLFEGKTPLILDNYANIASFVVSHDAQGRDESQP